MQLAKGGSELELVKRFLLLLLLNIKVLGKEGLLVSLRAKVMFPGLLSLTVC